VTHPLSLTIIGRDLVQVVVVVVSETKHEACDLRVVPEIIHSKLSRDSVTAYRVSDLNLESNDGLSHHSMYLLPMFLFHHLNPGSTPEGPVDPASGLALYND
jgi:hypothetical protein